MRRITIMHHAGVKTGPPILASTRSDATQTLPADRIVVSLPAGGEVKATSLPNFDPSGTAPLTVLASAIATGGFPARATPVGRTQRQEWPALGLQEPPLTEVLDDVFLSIGDTPADILILRESGLFR